MVGMAIQRVKWALLSEWWCAPITATEDEIAKAVEAEFLLPSVDTDMIKDRLFGGFKCEEGEKRHIFFATGYFTYIDTNHRFKSGDRKKIWATLLAKANGFIGGGSFSIDAPHKRTEKTNGRG